VKRPDVRTVLWSALGSVALLWPARVLSPLDGMPLNGRAEALLIGLLFPALLWFAPSLLRTRTLQVLVGALLVTKLSGFVLAPEGLCARFSTAAPLSGVIQTIPIDEPTGVLRSWDVRADWTSAPACTAIIDRAYPSATAFPAWFVNVVDFITPEKRDIRAAIAGYVTVPDDGTLTWQIGEDMTLSGQIGSATIDVGAGNASVALTAGVHALVLDGTLTGDRWRLVPTWNGNDAWTRVTFTRTSPGVMNALAPVLRWLTPAFAIGLLGLWTVRALRPYAVEGRLIAWTVAASLLLVLLALDERTARVAPALLIAAAVVPLARTPRHLRTAFLLVGVPWLAFFAARALPQIGQFATYSADDWLTYQVAGYRIFMHGYWLEGGTAAFDYQPLYRWMTGALHAVFGDSSVGELFWDAACLLSGALLAFYLVKVRAGFQWGLAAMVGTLVTFTAGTPWYFLGRGLSEIAAAGWAFLAIFFLLRARKAPHGALLAATLCAVLMFYTRLNHLLFGLALAVFLLPLRTRLTPAAMSRAVGAVPLRRAALYFGGFAAGVVLFMSRTWLYTGVFALFHGTSLRHNDTGLRPWTVLDPEVWSRVGHSLAALVFMNEPPSPDPRAVLVALGAAVAIAAIAQVPIARRQGAVVVLGLLGAAVGALFAHAHHYPGRLSIHLVPLAVALTMGAAGALVPWRSPARAVSEAEARAGTRRLPLRRRVLFATVAFGIALLGAAISLLAVDIYLHSRFERSAGFNIWGYRGPAVGAKQPGEYRVVMLGGSSAYGYGVEWHQAIPAELGTRLANRGVFTVINLGYNNEGAYSFRFTLEDYLHLQYDLAILYEGYNDMMGDPRAPNLSVFRRDSPVFRLTGYLPIFPIVFKEKAAAMLSGGDASAYYTGGDRTVFRPGFATRTAAEALMMASAVGESLERQLDRMVAATPRQIVDPAGTGCEYPWQEYCRSVLEAVRFALQHDKQVMVVTQPYELGEVLRPRHMWQQREMSAAVARSFAGDPRVRYLNLGGTVDLEDPKLSFDRMHLTAEGNQIVAAALVEPVVEMSRIAVTR
jgi:hypothetical protein